MLFLFPIFAQSIGEKYMIKHLACIMDGNRRWARLHNKVPWYGHKEGVEAVKRVMNFCLDKKVPYLSLYTFSLENFKRSFYEKKFLFQLLVIQAEQSIDELIARGIRVRFVGDRTLFPQSTQLVCDKVEKATAHLTTLQLNFLFCYGAQQEIIGGIKNIVQQVQAGQLTIENINESMFKEYLWIGNIPEPDLILRTGGIKRLSNFLLYQAAYSELYFLDCLWPELTVAHLTTMLDEFMGRQRNFGI
jgi:undecaprenyl diphosphate synthase